MVNQEELIKGTLQFIDAYNRLPFFKEDDIEVEKLNDDGQKEFRPYRALKYIKEIFDSESNYTRYLFDNKILTFENIAQHLQIKPDRVEELLSEDAKKVTTDERRSIHVFFGVDYYYKLGEFSKKCNDCSLKKECGQYYWVTVIQCEKYKKEKVKSK